MSVTRAPSPWSMTAGTWMSKGSLTTFALHSSTAADFGPGTSVTRLIAVPMREDLLDQVPAAAPRAPARGGPSVLDGLAARPRGNAAAPGRPAADRRLAHT